MKKFNFILLSIIVALILYLFLFRPKSTIVTKTITKFKYDTVQHYINKYITLHDTVLMVDSIPAHVDTLLILKDYFSKHVINREFKDTSLLVNLTDTISQNKFFGSKFEYKLLKPQTIITNTTTTIIKDNRWNIGPYVGIGFNSSLKANLNLGISLQYRLFSIK